MNIMNNRWSGYLLLLFKKHLLRPITYFIGALCVVLLLVFGQMVLPGGDGSNAYGLVVSEYSYADRVLEYLQNTDDVYTLKVYSSREDLLREVISGRLDCGFVLNPMLNEISDLGHLNGCIDYYSSPSTSRGFLLKEKVFAAVLRSVAQQTLIHMSTSGDYFDVSEEARDTLTDTLLSYYSHYLEGNGTLEGVFETVDVDGTLSSDMSLPADSSRTSFALCSLLIFAAALLFGRNRFLPETRNIRKALRGFDRRFWDFAEILAPTLLAAVPVAVCEALKSHNLFHGLSLLLCAILCALWSFCYSSFFRREALYIPSLTAVLLMAVFTCDALIRITAMIPIFRVLKWVFPVNYF